ncbi:hypothetical protein QBC36DRAFT_63012 [Triangularia setosa]|uniref:Uncharacterized protein n=1 Tax=Triangularia setosa TaxID=2587417 RepID=A0AAN6W2F4_9PEZI|nr:hypothetical protein QBC36DRAFT_63012 [Podospora setosa]
MSPSRCPGTHVAFVAAILVMLLLGVVWLSRESMTADVQSRDGGASAKLDKRHHDEFFRLMEKLQPLCPRRRVIFSDLLRRACSCMHGFEGKKSSAASPRGDASRAHGNPTMMQKPTSSADDDAATLLGSCHCLAHGTSYVLFKVLILSVLFHVFIPRLSQRSKVVGCTSAVNGCKSRPNCATVAINVTIEPNDTKHLGQIKKSRRP